MLVRVIRMRGFMSHKDTRIELPERGVVLITGANGVGKSSFVEAVATAGWNKTLRGTTPWSGKGAVDLITNDHDISRTCTKGGTKKLKWEAIDGDEPIAFESTTKAQAALEAEIGSFDIWRRTSVFSSQDAAHFTTATDGQRKKLLEQLIGLDRFDPALDACRADRRAAEANLTQATSLLTQLVSQLETGYQRKEDAQSVLDTIPEPPNVAALKAKLAKLNALHEAAKKDVRHAEARIREMDRAGADETAQARALKRQLDNLGEGNCDRCGQPITDELRAPLLSEFEEADKAAHAACEAVIDEGVQAREELEDLQEEAEELRAEGQDLDRQVRAFDGQLRQRQTAEKAVTSAGEALEGLQERINSGRGVIEERTQALALLKAVEQVLGLKGVRAHVLGKALGGIENAANVWLNRIVSDGQQAYPIIDDAGEVEAMLGGPMCLRLKPYSEKKTGGISDCISLDVIGAGGGYGYKASSGGERRRIDVALLLALAEVAQAAHGQMTGTLFIDEALDSLDEDGVERVIGVLEEMAEDRCIVLISHNADLCRAVRASIHYRVDHGTLSVV